MAINEPFEFFLQWHLTERCNLRCRHCYQTGADSKELSIYQIRATITEATSMIGDWEKLYGVTINRSCNITGGEPFLRDNLFIILEELSRHGFALFLLSNGTLIDRQRAAELATVGVKGVQISIEGPEKVHDYLRGRESYRRAVLGAQNLLEAGLPVTFNVTLSRVNAAYLNEMIETAAKLGIQRVGFSRLVPTGQGAELRDRMLTLSELENLYTQISHLKISGLAIVTGDPIHWQINRPAPSISSDTPYGGCAAGVSGLTLLPDGTILPCRRLNIPLGNVRTDSLREIWATSDVLNRLRTKELYGGKCGACPRWSSCRGCRAIAFAYSQMGGQTGDYLASDPQCFIG